MLKIDDTTKVTRQMAERIEASALVNHDTNSDLVTLTCALVIDNRRAFTYGEAREILKAECGVEFDAEGWMI